MTVTTGFFNQSKSMAVNSNFATLDTNTNCALLQAMLDKCVDDKTHNQQTLLLCLVLLLAAMLIDVLVKSYCPPARREPDRLSGSAYGFN
jgi:hypothetical protein